MRQWLIDFLKALEAKIPPPVKCHHAITYAQYGSDETGWVEQLVVQSNSGGMFHPFFLDDTDCVKLPESLVAEIAGLLAHPMEGEQLSVGIGQYIP